jgi:hypothetical protein
MTRMTAMPSAKPCMRRAIKNLRTDVRSGWKRHPRKEHVVCRVFRSFCGRFPVRDVHADLFYIWEEAEFREVPFSEPLLRAKFTLETGITLQRRDANTFVAASGMVYRRVAERET